MALDFGQQIPGELEDPLNTYSKNAMSGYDEDMSMLKRDASRELEAEITGGNQQGRVVGFQRRSLDQEFSDEADRFKSGVGLKRAELGETLRQKGQDRLWQVEDRNTRLERLRKLADAQKSEAEGERRGNFLSQIFGSVGKIGGAIAGGIYGGPAGAVVGSEAGGGIGDALGGALGG